VDIKRRAELIPSLVETLKGLDKQEQSVIGQVVNAQAVLLGAKSKDEEIAANNQLSEALGRLLVLQENDPDLKSNRSFLQLQDELAGTENRIAVSRRDYNEAIKKYNTDVDLFPRNIAASIFGFRRDDAYFRTFKQHAQDGRGIKRPAESFAEAFPAWRRAAAPLAVQGRQERFRR
jgi:LemA protein